jgi:hypothetical protein
MQFDKFLLVKAKSTAIDGKNPTGYTENTQHSGCNQDMFVFANLRLDKFPLNFFLFLFLLELDELYLTV